MDAKAADLERQLTDIKRDLDSLAYSISHDLRAPLRHIAGFAETLVAPVEKSLDADARRHLGNIIRAASTMQQQLDGLLEFSRVSRKELNITTINLKRLVQELVEPFLMDEAEWRIGELADLRADEELLRIALFELISNARKFSIVRTPPQIEVAMSAPQTLMVRDNGVGFDMKYAERLFGLFQRFHSDREFEGAGVGLAITRRVVEKHGGRIWAESQPGQGAAFFFTLSHD